MQQVLQLTAYYLNYYVNNDAVPNIMEAGNNIRKCIYFVAICSRQSLLPAVILFYMKLCDYQNQLVSKYVVTLLPSKIISLYIIVVMIQKKCYFLLFLGYMIAVINSQGGSSPDMCSIYCSIQQCNSLASNNCKNCRNPFVNDGSGKCILNPTSGYQVVSVSDDTTSFDSFSNSLSTTASFSATCSNTSGGQNKVYTYYGNFSGTQSIVFQDISGPSVPHYQLRVMFWVILIDNWNNNDYMKVTTNTGETLTQRRDTKVLSSKICGGGDWQDELIFDKSYAHNTSNPVTLTITANSSTPQKWGIKQVMIIARLCHVYCLSCYGALSTQCTYCEQDTPYKLSATTCALTCLAGYGDTIAGDICVLCDLKCIQCYQLPQNCTSCKTFGTYQSFLITSNYSCETNCPIAMYGNVTDHICYFCQQSCVSCKYSSSYCYGCVQALGFAWKDYTCYNPCPARTFLNNNSANCTACSPFCEVCQNSSTTCLSCTLTGYYEAYLFGTDCVRSCPVQYYKSTNNGVANTCQSCDISCYVCFGNPTPCTECNANYYLFQSACGETCPQPEYFADQVTRKCLLCQTWCVKLVMKMYYPTAINQKIYTDLKFSEQIDFNTFPYKSFQTFTIDNKMYSLDMFNFTYEILNKTSYRIIMEPKGYIFLYNATITCTTITYPGISHNSANLRPFRQDNYGVSTKLIWFVIKAPDMSDGQKLIMTGLSGFSDLISNITTLPYVQQIKKMGIFAMLFGGAQITSTSVLINSIPSQNLYEGARFWAIFVFFDVPLWEKNSDKTRHFVVPSTQNKISETSQSSKLSQKQELFPGKQIEWRFQRTGHTSFFIFDTYGIIVLIALCWILLLVGYCLNKNKPLLFKKHMGKFYSLLHKVHEMSILYIMLSTILQWIYFDPNQVRRWISFGLCLVFNIYFLGYELSVYYDMIKYPAANIGSQKYEKYAIKYGSLLKNIRYQQYDLKDRWSPKQWFRPYNYHILSYYKKLMMIVSLPLFYNTNHAQISVLIALQIAQTVRFCVVWPFYKKWRNIYRLILECSLLMFFICILIQGFLVQEIMLNNPQTVEQTIQQFYRFGWIGFSMCFFFNIGFIVLYVIDIYRGCKMTNRQMMDEARRVFYYNKLKNLEQQNQDVPLGLINKWVKNGNLNNRNYEQLVDINFRLEYYRIVKIPNSKTYEIQMKKVFEISMAIQFSFSKQNNIEVCRKLATRFILTKTLDKDFYQLVDNLFHQYRKLGCQSITIKTYQKIQQSILKPGQRIQINKQHMTQKLQIQNQSGLKQSIKLDKLLNGFPLSEDSCKFLL